MERLRLPFRRRPNGIEPDGEFRQLAGRAIGGLFVGGGVMTLVFAASLTHAPVLLAVMLLVAVGAFAAGVVCWRLPWHRWSRRTLLWPLVPALVLMGLGNAADPDPYLVSIFYFLFAMWVGVAHPRGTMLLLSPLFGFAYWLPIALVPHAPGLERSVVYIVAICVLAGECLAWLTARLHSAQRRLRQHDERRFRALLTASSDATVVLSRRGEFTYASPSASQVLHLPAEVLDSLTMAVFTQQRVHPDDAGSLEGKLQQLLSEAGAEETVQFRVRGDGGTWFDVEGLGRNLLDDEDVHGVLLNLRDVSERTDLERALTTQAFSDQLTGLPNRALLQDRTEQALRLAGRHGVSAALLLIDLDRFKEVNDTLGHHNGDLLLQQVAERLGTVLRDTDTVARLGGDEFAVLLPQLASVDDAIAVAEKVGAVLETPFTLDGLTLEVDGSVGLALYPDHACNAAELLQRADVAMYAAKSAHLGYVVYEPHLDQHSPRRLGLLGQLRRAIANDEFIVHYQPKAEASTGRILGVEALIRWQHPEHGVIGPGEFIPLAETTGLIRPLTSHVLGIALRDCRDWLDAGEDLSVAVNVSARCLLDLGLPVEIERMTAEHGVPTDRLVLEITESAIMSDPNRALEVLNRLHALGVRLSIDDFGTGYSSMAYLKNLPVHELKVDRSFVTHMRDRHSELVIVRSTVDLGHNLGMHVVAEGVEDEDTWRVLDSLGCDAVQGYFLGKPMPAARLGVWLAERHLAGVEA